MAQYGDIKISDDLWGHLKTCGICKKQILLEEKFNGVSHTIAQIVTCWDCLGPQQQAAALGHYKLKPEPPTQ